MPPVLVVPDCRLQQRHEQPQYVAVRRHAPEVVIWANNERNIVDTRQAPLVPDVVELPSLRPVIQPQAWPSSPWHVHSGTIPATRLH